MECERVKQKKKVGKIRKRKRTKKRKRDFHKWNISL